MNRAERNNAAPLAEAAPVSSYQAWQMQRVQRASRFVMALVVLAFAAVVGRVVWLKTVPSEKLLKAAGSAMSVQTELARRGEIRDRSGRVIAASTVGYRLFVDPAMVADSATIAIDLARIIGGDPIDIDRKIIERSDTRYVPIVDELEDWQVDALRKQKIKGVGLEPRQVRHYPFGDTGAAVVGLVGFEHTGLGAAELQFNSMLVPTAGKLSFLRDARRRALWIEQNDYTPGSHGQSLTITLDMVVQDIAERRLEQAVKQYNAGGGRIIVFDPQAGEVLAMHDMLRSRGWTEEIKDAARKIHRSLGRNRCITDPYEPGSTFKPFIWAAATELGRARPTELLQCAEPGEVHRTPYGRSVRDTHYYGPSTWHTVLVKSINSGMAIVAERLTHKEMRGAITLFGFGSKTGSKLPGESAGILTNAKKWSKYTQTSVSYGHEISVTPLQMVRAFSVFATGGYLPEVRFIRSENAAQTLDASSDWQQRTIISPETIRLAKEAMRDVFTSGTGRLAQSQKYEFFGKSGTAQLPRMGRRGYHEDRYISSFIAAAPYEQPRLVVLVIIDDPDRKIGHLGGAIAGPVVRDVMEQSLEYLGVPALPVDEQGKPITIARSN